jgi:hypothetical protein
MALKPMVKHPKPQSVSTGAPRTEAGSGKPPGGASMATPPSGKTRKPPR